LKKSLVSGLFNVLIVGLLIPTLSCNRLPDILPVSRFSNVPSTSENMKTYTDSENSYSIQYPVDWKEISQTDREKAHTPANQFIISPEKNYVISPDMNENGLFHMVTVFPSRRTEKDTEKLIERIISESENSRKQKARAVTFKGYKAVEQDFNYTNAPTYYNVRLVVFTDSFIYELGGDFISMSDRNIIENIISSFQPN
jgi:hypothetical protein